MNNLLTVSGLHKCFIEGKVKTPVLQGIDFSLGEAEVVAILGASGSGKTTFLQIVGGLQSFDAGEVSFLNQPYSQMSDTALTMLREKHFGYVYQFHHLLPELTALENVMLPLMIRKMNKAHALADAKMLLEATGLAARLHHKPGELSGGERQRVALARAMVKKPHILFADEPTGNLDRHSSQNVMSLMFKMSQDFKTSIVFITHDEALAQQATRILRMTDGFLADC